MRQLLGPLSLAFLLAAAAPAGAASTADPSSLQNVTGLRPGYWKMHMVGTTHTPNFDVPINRINHVCLRPGDAQKKLFMPKTAGQCKTREDTDSDGTMHWRWTCTILHGATQGDGTVKTATDHFTSAWQMVSTLNLPSVYTTTTDMTLTGTRVAAQCPSRRR